MPSLRNYRNISYYDSTGKQLPYVDSSFVQRSLAEGDHEWICSSCGRAKEAEVSMGQCHYGANHNMVLRQLSPEEFDDAKLKAGGETDTSLTVRDMQRNVGITPRLSEDPDEPPNMGQVESTRRRIRFWGWASAHNAKAVTIIPRGSLPNPRQNVVVPA